MMFFPPGLHNKFLVFGAETEDKQVKIKPRTVAERDYRKETSVTATLLGIVRPTLPEKLKKYGIEDQA